MPIPRPHLPMNSPQPPPTDPPDATPSPPDASERWHNTPSRASEEPDVGNDAPHPDPRAPTFDERLLAQSLRILEDSGRATLGGDDAPQRRHDAPRRTSQGQERTEYAPRRADAAPPPGATFEHRIVNRAVVSPDAPRLRGAVADLHRVIGWVIAAGLVIALAAGAATARAALGDSRGEPANFFWILSSLLGTQTLLLLLWILLTVIRPSVAGVSVLGSAVFALARGLVARSGRDPGGSPSHHVAAISAASQIHASGPIGRWTLGAISHAFWLAANVAAVAVLTLLLSTREYLFNWETTILPDEAYVGITRTLAAVPEALGFLTPSADQIRASEAGAPIAALHDARQVWSWLLVGAMTAYGTAPRALLLVFCLLARRRACRRYRLDTTLPGFQRLRPILYPAAEAGAVVADLQGGSTDSASERPLEASAEIPAGPPVILGLEIERPPGRWPPEVPAVRWHDLGFVDGREDERRIIEQLRLMPSKPRLVAVVCSLTMTPDRGIGEFIRRLHGASASPAGLVLTSGHALRRRGGGEALEARISDWRRLGRTVGIDPEHILELDLDHLTDAGRQRLAALVGDAPVGAGSPRRIEAAFHLITEAVGSWSAPPDAAAQARLHHRVAALYHHQTARWRDKLRLPTSSDPAELAPALRRGADHVLAVLPPRLRQSPKWLAAGAASGALGCIAAATLISPVAIGALPVWSAIGAAVAAAVQLAPRDRKADTSSPQEDAPSTADAIRAAAMFALLLELQGRNEGTISRLLDGALPPDSESIEDATLADPEGCAAWLDGIRHRLDLALAAEAGP